LSKIIYGQPLSKRAFFYRAWTITADSWDDDPRRFGFHNLRHSLASFLIRIRTDPKTVQTLLRHSDVRLTLQFYTHAVSRDRMVARGKC